MLKTLRMLINNYKYLIKKKKKTIIEIASVFMYKLRGLLRLLKSQHVGEYK